MQKTFLVYNITSRAPPRYLKPYGAKTTGKNQPLFRIYLRSWIDMKDFVFQRSTFYGQEMEKI